MLCSLSSEDYDLWIKHLRSGNYKQITGRLCEDGGYCALGVMLLTLGWTDKNDTFISPDYSFGFHATDNPVGFLHPHLREQVILLNDQEELSFSDIADLLEAEKDKYYGGSVA